MEPYLLTQEDIDKLVALNKDMNGVPVGAEATSTEIEALGIQPAAPAVTPVTAPAVTPVTAPAVTPVTAPDQSPVSAPANDNMALLQQMLGAQKPAQPFSYESMSKDQRRMLAFAGLSDAGRALQGMQGGKVEALLGRFNEQADMQRKATAAQAQQQMLAGIIGPGAAAGGSIEAQIEMLTNAAIAYPNMAPGLAVKIKALQDQLQQQGRDKDRGRAATSTLRDIDSIISMIDEDPTLTTGTWAWMTRGIPMSAAGKTQALIDSVVSSLALDSLKALKATGATMGALNQSELEILKTELAKVDLAAGQGQVKTQLGKVKGHYRTIISDLYNGASEEDEKRINAFLGLDDKPSWVGGSTQPSGTQRDGETLEEFKKRMGL
jgi:hypothetical protein